MDIASVVDVARGEVVAQIAAVAAGPPTAPLIALRAMSAQILPTAAVDGEPIRAHLLRLFPDIEATLRGCLSTHRDLALLIMSNIAMAHDSAPEAADAACAALVTPRWAETVDVTRASGARAALAVSAGPNPATGVRWAAALERIPPCEIATAALANLEMVRSAPLEAVTAALRGPHVELAARWARIVAHKGDVAVDVRFGEAVADAAAAHVDAACAIACLAPYPGIWTAAPALVAGMNVTDAVRPCALACLTEHHAEAREAVAACPAWASSAVLLVISAAPEIADEAAEFIANMAAPETVGALLSAGAVLPLLWLRRGAGARALHAIARAGGAEALVTMGCVTVLSRLARETRCVGTRREVMGALAAVSPHLLPGHAPGVIASAAAAGVSLDEATRAHAAEVVDELCGWRVGECSASNEEAAAVDDGRRLWLTPGRALPAKLPAPGSPSVSPATACGRSSYLRALLSKTWRKEPTQIASFPGGTRAAHIVAEYLEAGGSTTLRDEPHDLLHEVLVVADMWGIEGLRADAERVLVEAGACVPIDAITPSQAPFLRAMALVRAATFESPRTDEVMSARARWKANHELE